VTIVDASDAANDVAENALADFRLHPGTRQQASCRPSQIADRLTMDTSILAELFECPGVWARHEHIWPDPR
jgi:hypothetical protein